MSARDVREGGIGMVTKAVTKEVTMLRTLFWESTLKGKVIPN